MVTKIWSAFYNESGSAFYNESGSESGSESSPRFIRYPHNGRASHKLALPAIKKPGLIKLTQFG